MKCQVDAIQGGGVVAEFFCGLRKPTRFSGGGVVAEFLRGLQKPTRFSEGGSTRNFPLMGPFYIFRLSQRGPAPPLNRPLEWNKLSGDCVHSSRRHIRPNNTEYIYSYLVRAGYT